MTTHFGETLHDGFEQVMRITEKLADERSDYQRIQIFDTARNGRVMALDGIVQITTRDEAAYSEMLTHVPIMARRAAGLGTRRVLIVGGGDCAVAEEALKHKSVDRVDMAEIDGRVVELCREHFASINAAVFTDARFNLSIVDAFEHLKTPAAAGAYDVIIADRPDPVGPAQVLFADAFYRAVARALTPQGVAVFQNGVPFLQPEELSDTVAQLECVFAHVGVYLTIVPSYVGGHMALTWASNGLAPDAAGLDALRALWREAGLHTDHYSPDYHKAAFVLPPWIDRLAHPETDKNAIRKEALTKR